MVDGRRVAVVTGANTGVGRETALGLARLGFHVVLAVRPAKTAATVAALSAQLRSEQLGLHGGANAVPGCSLEAIGLELSEPDSPLAFAAEFCARHAALDVLVASAGLGGLSRTPEPLSDGSGLDLVFSVNVLGHFLLMQALLPAMRRARAPRVVFVSSVMHRWGEADWATQMRYSPGKSRYASSKLAALVLAAELNRRYGQSGSTAGAAGAGSALTAIAVNPGAVNSDIWYRGQLGPRAESAVRLLFGASFLTAQQGAATSLAAATDPALDGAGAGGGAPLYLAPYRTPAAMPLPFELHGPFAGPRPCTPHAAAADPTVGATLWAACEEALAPQLARLGEVSRAPGDG